jgi:hypothetical protein
MRLQGCAVIVNAIQHHGRNREDHPRRRKLPFGQHVMDQATVHAAVPILEGMDIDKAKCRGRRLQHRIDAVVAHAVVRLHHPAHEIGQIIGARSDKFRERIAIVVPLAQEDAVGAQTRAHESRVFNEDALQANDFIQRQPVFARLQHRAAPSLQAVARRTLSLDLKAGPAVGQQHETGGPRHQVRARAPHGFERLGAQVERQAFRERLGSPDHRTESAGTQEIVAHAMAFRKTRLAGEVSLGFQKIDGCGAGRVVHVESTAGQDFEEIPCAPRRNASGGGPHKGLDLGLGHRLEDPVQDREIQIFMAERKRQMIGKSGAGPVAFIEDVPASLFPLAAADMLVRDATGAPDGPAQGQRLGKRRPSGQSGAGWDGLLLEDRLGSPFSLLRSKNHLVGRKPHHIWVRRRKPVYRTSCRKPFADVEKCPNLPSSVEICIGMRMFTGVPTAR